MSGLAIPTWEQSDLQNLQGEGQLSGVPWQVLGAIDQAESSGQGGAINPEGYGGFFGLGEGSSYPAGTPSSSLLTDPSAPSFDEQAILAGSEFAKLLQGTGGDVYAAESKYQGGSTEGTSIFSSVGIPQTVTGAQPATTTGFLGGLIGGTTPQGVIGGAAGAAASGVWAQVEPFLAKAIFVIGGVALAVFGFTRLAKPALDDARSAAPLAAAAAA